MSNFIFMLAGYLPISIKYENRRAYCDAFPVYQAKGDIEPMLEIFAERQRQRLSEHLDILGGEGPKETSEGSQGQ